MILTPLTLQTKLWIYGILVVTVLIGEAWKDLWIYRQGQLTGSANEVKVQLQVQKENQLEFNKQREREIIEARAQAEIRRQQALKRVKDLETANQILNEQNANLQSALNESVPDDYIGVLNAARANFGQHESDPKPTPGTNEKVPGVATFAPWYSPMA